MLISSTYFFRKKFELSPEKMRTLQLEVTEISNKLTIDISENINEDKRLILGIGATEIEREWLYEYLRKQY